MQVTDVRLNMINKDGGVKAIGSFSLDNSFAVRGVRVMEDKNGHNFVAFPSREKSNGEYEDIAFPLSKDFYHEVCDAILDEFKKVQTEKENKDLEDTPLVEEEKEVKTEQEETKAPPKRGKSR